MEMDIFGVCRVCLNDSRAYSNVFEVLLSDNYLYEVLNDVCQLEVKSDDGLPQFLCCECYEKLAMFDSFKRLSHKGSATLQSLKSDLENVQVKVEPDFYEAEYIREESMEADAKQCQEEVVIKKEPEDSLHFEENYQEEWHGLDIQPCVKNEEGTGVGFSPVQTELYLPVKTEVEETFPDAGPTDPLKDESNAEVGDPLHFDEESRYSTCDWYTKGRLDSPGEHLGVRVNAEQVPEKKEQLYDYDMVHDGATNNGSGSTSDGIGGLGVLSLQDVNKRDQNVSNDVNKRQTVKCEASDLGGSTFKVDALKSDKRNDSCGEFEGMEEDDSIENANSTFINSECSDSEEVSSNEEGVETGNDSIGESNSVCLNCNVCGKVCIGEKEFLVHSKLHYSPGDNGSKFGDDCSIATGREGEGVSTPQMRSDDCHCHSTSETRHSGTEDKPDACFKPYECNVCGERFSKIFKLKSHLDIHSADKHFKCSQCDRAFAKLTGLRRHERIHFRETPFKCDVCGKEFPLECRLKKHLTNHTGQKPFKCKSCEKSFNHISQLTRHETKHTGERAFKCSHCGKAFVSSYNLRKHEVEHVSEKNFQCRYCQRLFAHAKNLAQHERRHIRERRFGCDNCEKKFWSNFALRQHEMMHRGEKPYKCNYCDKTFPQFSRLKRHELVHTGEKALHCKWCNKAFGDISGLTRHVKTHSGERPYSCDRCDKSFSMKSYLKAHMLLHTDRKSFQCSSCPKTFSSRANLKRHESVHTDEAKLPNVSSESITSLPLELVETQYLDKT